MSKKNETEVAVREEHAVAQVSTGLGRGLEDIDMKDIQVPVALIIQKMSKLLDDPDFQHRPGTLVHSLLLEKLDMPFVPLKIYKDNRFDLPIDEEKARPIVEQLSITEDMMFNPGKGCVCYARDGKTGSLYGDCSKCGKNKFDDVNHRVPLCSTRVNVLALFDGYPFPVLIRFGKTSKKHGDKLVSMLALSGGDIFTKKFKISVLSKSDAKNSWFEIEAKPAGKVAPEEIGFYEGWFNRIAMSNVVVEEPEEETLETVRETEY